MSELALRTSDADRERTVELLRAHLLAGRLTLDEFSQRVDLAYDAQTGEELARAEDGLPAVVSAPSSRRRVVTALFGHVERRGRFLIRRLLAIGVLADLDLDLRAAWIDRPRARVTLFVLFGNTDLYVPEGFDVDVRGLVLAGRVREWGRETGQPGMPQLCVRAFGLFGTVDVWRVPPNAEGRYREIVRRLQNQQAALPGLNR